MNIFGHNVRRRSIALLILGAFALFVYFNNAAWLAAKPSQQPVLLAHRGVHQIYDRQELKRDTCTAERIKPPSHDYIENTLPSMAAAFEDGADVVEIDVHPTTDGHFAVFHDWALECRTNGHGVTREQTMSYLKTLDIGYGYTADGGQTFPLRGKGLGLMPSLTEVLDSFPGKGFLINIKSNDPDEGDLLAEFLTKRPKNQVRNLMVYGGEKPTTRLLHLMPTMRGFTRHSVMACFKNYLAIGWTGHMPEACRHTVMLMPINYARYVWGWPQRFVARMHDVGSEVYVVGPFAREDANGTPGIDDLALLGDVPVGNYDGGIWTNTIELIGPNVRASVARN